MHGLAVASLVAGVAVFAGALGYLLGIGDRGHAAPDDAGPVRRHIEQRSHADDLQRRDGG